MMNTATAPEFAEGTVDLASEVWFCVEHSVSMHTGQECPWCVYDRLGPHGFERWAAEQRG